MTKTKTKTKFAANTSADSRTGRGADNCCMLRRKNESPPHFIAPVHFLHIKLFGASSSYPTLPLLSWKRHSYSCAMCSFVRSSSVYCVLSSTCNCKLDQTWSKAANIIKLSPIAKFQSSKPSSWEVFRSWFRSLWKRESQMWVLSSTIRDVRCDVFSPQSERRRQICFKSLRCRCEVGHSGSRRHGCQRSGSAPKSDDTGPLPCVKTRATQNTRLHILCSTRIL